MPGVLYVLSIYSIFDSLAFLSLLRSASNFNNIYFYFSLFSVYFPSRRSVLLFLLRSILFRFFDYFKFFFFHVNVFLTFVLYVCVFQFMSIKVFFYIVLGDHRAKFKYYKCNKFYLVHFRSKWYRGVLLKYKIRTKISRETRTTKDNSNNSKNGVENRWTREKALLPMACDSRWWFRLSFS